MAEFGPLSFSISMSPTTSASIAVSALTIFASWRSNSNWCLGAASGREAAAGPVAVEVVEDVERRDLHVPPTGGGAAGRGLRR